MLNVNSKTLSADLMLVLTTGIWGAGFIATEYAINAGWGATLIMTVRFLVAALVLTAAMGRKLTRITASEWKHGFLAGVFLFLAFYAQTVGQSMTTVSNAAFITATNVVIVPFISWPINKDKPGARIVLLTLTALAGVGVLSFRNGQISFGFGDLFILLCAGLFALHITWLEKATLGRNPSAVNYVQILTAAAISLVLAMAGGWQTTVGRADLAAGVLPVLYLGLFSTGLCFFLQTTAQKYTTAARAGVILSLEGFFGSLFAVLLGIEPISANLVIGGIMIISAAILINLKQVIQRVPKRDPRRNSLKRVIVQDDVLE